MSVLAVLLSLAGFLVLNPPATWAAPGCPSAVRRPAAAPSGTPWTLQRYDQARLNAFADGRGIVVAVIDSGVDGHNPQLQGAVQSGTDQLDGGASVLDCVGHGTGVAGIIAARPTAGSPFHGLAPAATILALRVTEQIEGDDGAPTGRRGTPAGLAAAIREAVSRRARVINLSLVSYTDDPAVRDAVHDAVAADVVLVAAAGNGALTGNRVPYPAAYDGVIGVGGIAPDGQHVPTSQTGPYVDLVAPGAQVVTTATPEGLQVADGTSFATPFVAAAAALLRQYRPELTAQQVAAQLIATADGGHAGPGFGAGVLNPYRALTESPGASPKPVAQPLAQSAREADAAAESTARRRAVLLGSAGLLAVAIAFLVAMVLPAGRRRGWRPGVRELPPAETTTPDHTTPAFGPPAHR
jgi:type VII secretion-associated serine protease mycosin